MRITHEADYAIRVVYCLAEAGEKLSSKEIAEQSGITLWFALKILRKLILAGIVKSYKGSAGGYELNRPASEISLGELVECIDGPILITHCLSKEFDCSRVEKKSDCTFRKVFLSVNRTIRQELYDVKMDRFIQECDD